MKIKEPKIKMVKMCHILKLQKQYYFTVNNDYQQESRVLYTFISNKPFGSLLEIYRKNNIFFKTFNSEFLANAVSFTDQISQSLEIGDRKHYKNELLD